LEDYDRAVKYSKVIAKTIEKEFGKDHPQAIIYKEKVKSYAAMAETRKVSSGEPSKKTK